MSAATHKRPFAGMAGSSHDVHGLDHGSVSLRSRLTGLTTELVPSRASTPDQGKL